MSYAPETYIHELDRRAFDALASFPGFQRLKETYSTEFNEWAAKIQFLSTAIRLNERQMPEVYTLLPSICEKLGIPVPELYYVISDEMNAATAGSENPYLFVTSALVNSLTREQIAAVIAHECGHIACRHYFYRSIARLLLSSEKQTLLDKLVRTKKTLSPAMEKALLFWDRCSELSADRAAVLCMGSAEPLIDALLKLNGYDERINREEFLKQALDLRQFVSASDDNRAIEQMIIQGESHPRLATRAHECAQWADSEQFRAVVNGTYTVPTERNEEQPVFSAEVTLEKAGAPGVKINVDEELARVNRELDRYTSHAKTAHYDIAILSGILSGAIDVLFVGDQGPLSKKDIAFSHKTINQFIQKYAEDKGQNANKLESAIAGLEQKYKVAQDNIWKGANIKVAAKDHHLADLAHHPTPVGLAAALAVRFLRVGVFVNKEGEIHFLPVETSKEELLQMLALTVITGTLNWLAELAEHDYEAETGREMPTALKRIVRLAANTPLLIEVVKCADNWFGHLVSDMGGSKNTAGAGMGIPGVFLSMMYEIAALPILKETGLTEFLNQLYVKQKFDMRHELALLHGLGRQAIPVVLNELLVRTFYFVDQLAQEYGAHKDLKSINWERVIPFGNRTVDRMLTISSLTFTMADAADAAVHAAIESGADWVVFSGKFLTRVNYVGAGRAVLAVAKEVSSEKREAQLIHEKMLLSEIKTEAMFRQLQLYKAALEEKISSFLKEDLEAFLLGFNYMKKGIETGNSDLYIHGNVVIQNALGRQEQFGTQEEFDDLMDSDDDFKL